MFETPLLQLTDPAEKLPLQIATPKSVRIPQSTDLGIHLE